MAWSWDPRKWFKPKPLPPPPEKPREVPPELKGPSTPETWAKTIDVVGGAPVGKPRTGIQYVEPISDKKVTTRRGGRGYVAETTPRAVTTPTTTPTGTIAESVSPGTTTTTGYGGGLFALTPAEARSYKGTYPVWEIESPNVPTGWAEAIDVESKWIGTVPARTYESGFGEKPKGTYEYSKADISIAKTGYRAEVKGVRASKEWGKEMRGAAGEFSEDYTKYIGKKGITAEETTKEGVKGITYTMTPEYYKTLPSYQKVLEAEKGIESYKEMFGAEGAIKPELYSKHLLEARKSWGALPSGVKSGSRLASWQLGVMKGGTGIAEGMITFASKFGVQTIDLKETTPKKFSFGTEYMKMPSEFKETKFIESPTKWGKELVTQRPTALAVGGVYAGAGALMLKGVAGNIKAYGFVEGGKETLSMFSPLRIRSGIYTLDVSKEFRTDVSKGGRTMEVMSKGGKKAITTTEATTDLFKIKLKSVQASELVGTKTTKGISISKISHVPYARFVGGKLTFGKLPAESFAGFSTVTPTGKIGFKGKQFTISPTRGTHKMTDISGIKSDLFKGKQFDLFGYRGGESISGFGRKPFSNIFKYFKGVRPDAKGYGVRLKPSEPSVKFFKTTGVKGIGGAKGKPSSVLQQSKTITKTTTKLITAQTTSLKSISKTLIASKATQKILPLVSIEKTVQRPRVTALTTSALTIPSASLFIKSKEKVVPVTKVTAITTPAFAQVPAQVPVQRPIEIELPIEEPILVTPTPITPTPSFIPRPSHDFPFSGGIFIPPLLPFGLTGWRGKKKLKRTRRKTKYTPTITAQSFKFTAPKIPTSYRIGAGALGGRPLISKPKIKTKVKVKKKIKHKTKSGKTRKKKKKK